MGSHDVSLVMTSSQVVPAPCYCRWPAWSTVFLVNPFELIPWRTKEMEKRKKRKEQGIALIPPKSSG
jgi:hypothetical protein